MDDLNRKRHAVYKLTYHAVFVIKYRRRVMTEPIITHMRQYATHLIEQCYQGKLLELNGEPDHIHILFELPATAAPSVVVCSLKTAHNNGWSCCCRKFKQDMDVIGFSI